MTDSTSEELLRLSQKLLECIANNDFAGYQALSDPALTGIEPQSFGQLLDGTDFHRFNMDNLGLDRVKHKTTICAPRVRLLGEVAIVTYTRINQRVQLKDGALVHGGSLETRVWHKQKDGWRHVHFHRSELVMSK